MLEVKQNTLHGIGLMTLSMASFAIADTFIKLSAGQLSSAHTALVLFGGSALSFIVLALYQGHDLLNKAAVSNILLLRYAVEMVGVFGIVQALQLVPLSTVGAILQATPLVAAAGAVLFLGEKVSWRRWSAISIGFVGVLMIVQPGTGSFDKNVLWAVIAMVGLSARDLTTRATPAQVPTTALAAYTMIAALPFALLWVWLTQASLVPKDVNVWLVFGMIGFGTAGYLMVTASIRAAPISVVSPFRYFRLLFLLLLGIVIFHERPGVMVLLGSSLIIASGLYAMWRERQLSQLNSVS